MYSILIYFETLVFMTLFAPLRAVRSFFRVLGDNAEWYSKNKVHWWQCKKSAALIEAQFNDYTHYPRYNKNNKPKE